MDNHSKNKYKIWRITSKMIMWGLSIILVFGLTTLTGQETHISQHVTVVGGSAGNMHAPENEEPNKVYGTTITVGQPFIGRSNSTNYSTDLGLWSFYKKEPDPPIVMASDGVASHPEYIYISWMQDILSPPATGKIPPDEDNFPEDSWRITRDGAFRANVPMQDPRFADNQSIFPGQIYEYGVKVSNSFGISAEGFDVGFTMPNGKISGQIFTPGPNPDPWSPPGNPVADVEVALSPIRGKSVEFAGIDSMDYAKVNASYNDSITTEFTVELWFNIDQNTNSTTLFDMGERLKVQQTTENIQIVFGGTPYIVSTLPNINTWHHIACVFDSDSLKLFYDGDSANFVNAGALNPARDIRIGKNQGSTEYFDGYLDDIRVWKVALTQEDIQRNMNRALFGDEKGLLGYWKFDEGTANMSFDMTKIKESVTLIGAEWSDNMPSIKLSDYTDEKGQYEIRGIWYDATTDLPTEYTVTPSKPDHPNFSPASKTVGLDRTSPQADEVRFLDESLFTVSGAITYQGTNCPVINAEILVDSSSNRPEIFTDANGEFSIDFEPNKSGVLTARFGGHFVYDTLAPNNIDTQYVDGHTFNLEGVEQGYHIDSIETDIAGVDFTNTHTESISGIVGGGKCLFPIGDVEIKLQTTPSCYERIDTVASGQEFTIDNLPPLDYNIIITRVDLDSTFYSGTLSLRDSSLTGQKYIYKAPLEVDFVGLPTNSCGINVVEQLQTDSIYIQVFENYGGNKCYLDEIQVEVNDEFSEKSYQEAGPLDSEGKNVIYFTPREPNILGGGEHPYQKKLEVTVTDKSGRKATNSFYAVVTGEKKSENNQFTTSTSEIPWFVLRSPPGDGSYTYFTDQQEITTNLSIYKTDAYGNQGTETLHLGWDKTVITGFGAAVETKWSLDMDAGHGWNVTNTDVDIDETSLTFTRSETYSTSGDEMVTGDDASVFVGGGLTITFGIATKVSVEPTTCEVQLDTTLVGDLTGFNSTYMFSKYYIENHLMPNLKMQWRVDGDSSSLKSLNYWDEILKKDSIAVANARKHDAYKVGTQQESSNISFDAGVSYEFMTSTDSSFTSGTQATVENSHEAFGSVGFTVDAFGYTNTYAHTWYDAKDTTETETETNTKTIGFVLDDNDPGDAFTVDVLRDTVWGMPVFVTKGGQSSRPWEEGTMRRQWAQLSIDPIVQADVEPDQEAVYSVNLGNLSETGETWAYNLSLLNETNPYGAIVKVNGNNLGSSGIDFEIEAGSSMDATLTIERGPVEYDYEDLTLMLAPPEEIEIADNLGTVPQNADFTGVTTYFIEPCSGVRIASSDEDWLINQKSGDSLTVTFRDFDTTDTELQRLALEYSKEGEDTWFTADKVSMDSVLKSGNSYQKITWYVDKLDDGKYNLRAKTACRLRDGYSQLYSGLIDRRSPQVDGTFQPADQILHPNDQISISLDEHINCDEIYPSTGELYFANSGDEIASELSCNENTLTITPANSVSNREIENQRLRAEVHFLKDLAGNTMNVDTLGWEFVVDRNPIHWNVNKHEQVVYIGEETVIPIELNNNGGEEMSFEFGKNAPIPDWLTISPMYGDVNPGGNLTIYLHVDPYLNLGNYQQTIYAETPMGDEPLDLNLKAMCPPPDWDFYAPKYQYSMTMTTEIAVQGELSIDEYDQVAAFVGDECRGWAELEQIVQKNDKSDKYMAFLTVYSNSVSGEELSFQIWDNSKCDHLWGTEQTVTFQQDKVAGSPSEPYLLDATGASAQQFELQKGWNWVSLNLTNDDMSFDNTLGRFEVTPDDRIIADTAYAQYSESAGWVGPLTDIAFNNTDMYQASIAEADTFPFIGFRIDPEQTPIYIESGWNWIGFPPQNNLQIQEALASMDMTTGDIIKSQFEFAQFDASLGWIGNLKWLEPDQGYMLNKTNPDTLYYPKSSNALPAMPSLAKRSKTSEDTIPEAIWNLEATKYQTNMTITGSLEPDTAGKIDPADAVAAFVDNDVRGLARPQYISSLDSYRLFMTVYGKPDENIEFKIWDADQDIVYRCRENVRFESNRIIGSARESLEFTKEPLRPGDKGYVPDEYSLGQNFPNPFNPITKIGFGVPEKAEVRVKVFNLLGQEVKTLAQKTFKPGYRFLVWNGRNNNGKRVTSGIYLIVMTARGKQNFRQVRKVALLK